MEILFTQYMCHIGAIFNEDWEHVHANRVMPVCVCVHGLFRVGCRAASFYGHAHSQHFVRDAFIFCVFEHSVAFADPGMVLRVLKYWAFSFRGAGLHNYTRECLERLHPLNGHPRRPFLAKNLPSHTPQTICRSMRKLE